jgi:DNA-binding XRE family transcriptional regulator
MRANLEKAIELLEEYIKKTGVSDNKLAAQIDINRRTLHRFLNNNGYDPQVSSYNKVITFLISVGYIEKS